MSHMASEHTPLITTVRVRRQRHRYRHNVLRRFCTIALSSTLVWLFLSFLVTVIVFPRERVPRRHNPDDSWSWPGCKQRNVTYDQLRQILLDTPSSAKAEEWSRYYTSGPHLAGKNYSQASIRYLGCCIVTS